MVALTPYTILSQLETELIDREASRRNYGCIKNCMMAIFSGCYIDSVKSDAEKRLTQSKLLLKTANSHDLHVIYQITYRIDQHILNLLPNNRGNPIYEWQEGNTPTHPILLSICKTADTIFQQQLISKTIKADLAIAFNKNNIPNHLKFLLPRLTPSMLLEAIHAFCKKDPLKYYPPLLKALPVHLATKVFLDKKIKTPLITHFPKLIQHIPLENPLIVINYPHLLNYLQKGLPTIRDIWWESGIHYTSRIHAARYYLDDEIFIHRLLQRYCHAKVFHDLTPILNSLPNSEVQKFTAILKKFKEAHRPLLLDDCLKLPYKIYSLVISLKICSLNSRQRRLGVFTHPTPEPSLLITCLKLTSNNLHS